MHELAAHYRPEQLRRLVLYHYDSQQAGDELEQLGYRVARPKQRILLPPRLNPNPEAAAVMQDLGIPRVGRA